MYKYAGVRLYHVFERTVVENSISLHVNFYQTDLFHHRVFIRSLAAINVVYDTGIYVCIPSCA